MNTSSEENTSPVASPVATPVAECRSCNAKNRLKPGTDAEKVPSCGRCGEPLPWLLDSTDTTFDRDAAAPVLVLVDLWAPWCGPCKMIGPILEDLSKELAGRLKVIKVNVDDNPQLAAKFNARSIPMMVLLKDGNVVDTLVGALPKAQLKQALEPHL